MRLLILSLISLVALNSCSNTESSDATQVSNGKIEFAEMSHDFGEMKEGEVVSHTFTFKNTGTDPVEILSVNVSCGCTVASKPEKPIGVGQEGDITINFNSKGKVGENHKSVGVISNAQNSNETLTFTATVIAAEETVE